MPLKLMMDVHVRKAVTKGLRLRGVDVVTAQEDGSRKLTDPQLLDRALGLNRLLFSQDDDLLAEAARRQATGEPFYSVVYAHQLRITIGRCIDDLTILRLPENLTTS